MKKWLIFLGGFITGLLFTIIVFYFISSTNNKGVSDSNNGNLGVRLFDEPGEIINEKEFEVFQVVAENAALVSGGTIDGGYFETVFAIMNSEGHYYYDNEKIKVPKNKVVRQVGIYQYPTKNENIKTVPIIKILDK